MMPQKFNNKTNGITQRRFLLHGNPLLADWVTEQIGAMSGSRIFPYMSKLKIYADDEKMPAGVYEHQVSEQSASGKIHHRSTTASMLIRVPSSMYR